MEPRVITSKSQYEQYLGEIDHLMSGDPASGSDEGKLLRTLVILVKEFENDNFKFSKPDPIEAIKFKMEERG